MLPVSRVSSIIQKRAGSVDQIQRTEKIILFYLGTQILKTNFQAKLTLSNLYGEQNFRHTQRSCSRIEALKLKFQF